MAKKQSDPKPKMGKRCGYESLPNGDIKVAPYYSQRLRSIQMERLALDETADAFTKALQKLYAPLQDARIASYLPKCLTTYGLDTANNTIKLNYETDVLSITPIGPAVGKSEER